jgi:large repetitive protein
LNMRCDLTDSLEVMTLTESGRWIITVVVTAEDSQSVNNTVQVLGADFDPNLSNNQAFVEHNITDVADLEIIKTSMGEVQVQGKPGGTLTLEPDQVTAGRILTYTLTITNNGPSSAENVVVQDNLPVWIEILDVVSSQGNCNSGTPGDVWDKTTCGLGALPPQSFVTVRITVKVPAWVPNDTKMRNNALVYSDIFDPNNANNFAMRLVTVNTWADLAVLKVQQPQVVTPSKEITYLITVSNVGPSDVNSAVVSDLIPVEIKDITWSCVPSEHAFCINNGSGSIYELLDIPNGESLTYTINGVLSSLYTITNTVNITAPVGIPDPYLDNNKSSVTNTLFVNIFPFLFR